MNRDELMQHIQNIGTNENEAERREMLATLQEEVGNLFTNAETLTNQNTQLTQDNENLRSANMKLFLRVGAEKGEPHKDDPGKKEPDKKMSFNDLFNEKGELK